MPLDTPSITAKAKVRKLNTYENSDQTVEEEVAVEVPVEIILNGKIVSTLMATPALLEELAIGFLLDEGIVGDKKDIVSVRCFGRSVDVKAENTGVHFDDSNSPRLILTSCGFSAFTGALGDVAWPKICSDLRIRAGEISDVMRKLSESSVHFSKTGATHSAAILQNGFLKAFAEDVGRHNAIDKVVGLSIRQGIDLSNVVLATTGRQPADLVLKAARVGIPVSVSMRGPIYSGITAAEQVGLTLVCFARGSRMNVYTHPERIML